MAQVPTPIPSPIPSAEIVEQATRVIDSFSNLGNIQGMLFVIALALVLIFVVVWSNRNNTSATITVLTSTISSQDKEISELKSDAKEFKLMHIESLGVISAQSTRSNDLFEAMNSRGLERDKQQQRMVESQAQIAADLKTMVTDGSVPLRKLMQDVASVMTSINALDTKASLLPEVISSIPALRTELNSKLDALMAEVVKRSTKPIPKMDMPASNNGIGEVEKGTP